MKSFTLLAALVGTVAAGRDGWAYIDDWNCVDSSCFVPYVKSVVTTGLNNVLLAFTMPTGSVEDPSWYRDSTGAYYGLTDAERADVQAHYTQHGARLWMSLGGGTYEYGTYTVQDPATIARLACTTAKKHGYYGVDFDLEGIPQGSFDQFYPWAVTASQTCADIIGHIVHAPQVPYLGAWLNYGYEKLIPNAERFLVQYYNQGPSRTYTAEASMWAPTTDGGYESYSDIVRRSAIYKNLVVIGKYIRPAHGGSGLVSASEFDALLKIGEDKYGYNNGYMVWKIPMAAETGDLSQFINSDIPTLAAGGSPGGPVPTTAPLATTTTKASVAPTQPPVATQPPVVQPTTTTKAATTTTKANGGNPPPPAGNIVGDCQGLLTHPNPDWAANCKELCGYYGSSTAFCPGATTGELLAQCVLSMHSASCQHV